VLKTYYQHRELYIATLKFAPRLDLAQRTAGDVEAPLQAPPLAGAVLVP
jgi:hypothetical protein